MIQLVRDASAQIEVQMRPNAKVKNTENGYHPWIQQHPFFTLGFSVVGFPEFYSEGNTFIQSKFQVCPEISLLIANNAEVVDSIPVRAIHWGVGVNDPRGLFVSGSSVILCMSHYFFPTICHRGNFCLYTLTRIYWPGCTPVWPGISIFLLQISPFWVHWSSCSGGLFYGKFLLWPSQCFERGNCAL